MSRAKEGIPNISLQSPAVDFIDNHLPKLDPFFANTSARYDPASGRYVADHSIDAMAPAPLDPLVSDDDYSVVPRPVMDKAMNLWDEIFPLAMERLKDTQPEPKHCTKPDYNIRDKLSWKQVEERLEAARQVYISNEGVSGKGRKIWRGAADKVQPAIQLVNYFPNVDIATPVLGVVKLLLEAMGFAAGVRNTVLTRLDDLEQILSSVEFFLGMFPGDETIKMASVKLGAAVFRAIELAIGFFIKNAVTKATSAALKAGEYQSDLVQSLDNIKTASNDLMQEAVMSSMHGSKNQLQRVLLLVKGVSHALHERLEQTIKTEERTAEGLAEVKTMILRLFDEHADIREKLTQLAATQPVSCNHLAAEVELRSRSTSPAPIRNSVVSKEGLLLSLNAPNLHAADLQHIIGKRELLPSDERERAEQIVSTTLFRTWLVSGSSSKLLVHGNFDSTQTVSALSLLCCTFVQALSARERFVPLVFFCGRHIDEDDRDSGGKAMMKSLILQLLTQRNFDESLPRCDIDPAEIRKGSVETLCTLFGWLVRQLPSDVSLFCLLDGILYYERPAFLDEMSDALASILRLTADASIAAALKVLVTSPTATTVVRTPFEKKGLILSMESMPSRKWGASTTRLERELGGDLPAV